MNINNLKLFRWLVGGEWYCTKHKGWVKKEVFYDYLHSGIDLVLLKWEDFKRR